MKAFNSFSIFTLLVAISVAGCASYHAKPLPLSPVYQAISTHVLVQSSALPPTQRRTHFFNTKHGLDSTDIAVLAVANNPDLKISRDEVKIARAQTFAAGLLPDPQISLMQAPATFPTFGTTSAFNIGINEDLNALLLLSTSKAAAQADQEKTDLTLLWKEWQTVTQARVLYIRIVSQERILELLLQHLQLVDKNAQALTMAVEDGYYSLDAADLTLATRQDLKRQVAELRQQMSKTRYELNALLGLDPQTQLILNKNFKHYSLSQLSILNALSELAKRRPDLLALTAGYQSQEQHYRAAILAQFPAINIGINRMRDNSNVYANGINITFSLPLLNRNRGHIAIEKATRQRLYDEYQQRLAAAHSEVKQLLSNQQLINIQLIETKERVQALQHLSDAAQTALQQRNIDLLNYTSIQDKLIAAKIASLTLEENLLEQQIALQTLLVVPLDNG